MTPAFCFAQGILCRIIKNCLFYNITFSDQYKVHLVALGIVNQENYEKKGRIANDKAPSEKFEIIPLCHYQTSGGRKEYSAIGGFLIVLLQLL